MFRKISSRVLEQRPAEEDRRKAAIDAALAKAPPPRASKENWTIGTNTAGLHAQGTGAEPAQIPPALSVPSASAWPSSGLPATVRRSGVRTGLAAALGPGKASLSGQGRAGHSGPKANIAVHIRRLERDGRGIPASIKRLALMFKRHGIPKDWLYIVDAVPRHPCRCRP